MQFTSKFNIGQTIFVVTPSDEIEGPYTIGQIRIEHTDSPGIPDLDGKPSIFGNYQPHKNYRESYMLVETGIESGTIWDVSLCFSTYTKAQDELIKKLLTTIKQLKSD